MPQNDSCCSSSDSDQKESNANLFNAIRKKKLPEEDKLKKIEQIFKDNPKPNVIAQDGNDKMDTPLHMAVRRGLLKIVNFLIHNGGYNNLPNKDKLTPLNLAKLLGNSDIITALERDDHSLSSNDKIKASNGSSNKEMIFGSKSLKRELDVGSNEEHDAKCKRVDNLPQKTATFSASGVKSTLHGVAYQWKILMLIAKRCQQNSYAFRLATEMNDAEKFDDAVLWYHQPGDDVQYSIFLQAKHIEVSSEAQRKISAHDLLTEKDDPFSLQKYFISYQKIKKRQLGENGKYVIYTNIDFDFADLKKQSLYLESFVDNDALLNFKHDKNLDQYFRFWSSSKPQRHAVVAKLKQLFEKTSEFKKIAMSLAQHLIRGESIKLQGLFKEYHQTLARYVIDVKSLKLKENFVDDRDLSPELSEFRKTLRQSIEDDLQELEKKDQKKRTKRDNDLLKMFGSKISISKGFQTIFEPEENPKLNNPERIANEIFNLISNKEKKNKEDTNKKIQINQNDKEKYEAFNSELSKLAGHVLVKGKNDNEVIFSNSVLEGRSELTKYLRDEFKVKNNQELKRKLIGYTFSIANFETCQECELENLIKSKPHFPQLVTDAEVHDFLKNLVFAVNQPNEIRLSELISEELGEEFNLIDADLITNDFQNKILGWLKEKQGRYISEDQMDSFFKEMREKLSQLILMGPTAEYSKKLQEYGIAFDDKCFYDKLKYFLDPSSTDKSILNIIVEPKLTLLGSVKISQEIFNKRRGSYIFIRLNSFIRLKDDVLQAFRKEQDNLLVIECTTTENVQVLYNELYEELFEKGRKHKVIFISTRDSPLDRKFVNRAEYLEIVDEIKFSNLNNVSQKRLLEKMVIFQGEDVSLKQIIIPESPITDLLPLADLLEGKTLEIGKSLPKSNGYDELNYIDRTFYPYIEIKQSVRQEIKSVCFSEKMFKTRIESDPTSNIHWLNSEPGLPLIWRKSSGELKELHQHIDSKYLSYIDEDRSYCYPFENLKHFLLQAQEQKVMVISGTAGTGKSTILTHFSNAIKKVNPNYWVVRIDLNQHTDSLTDEIVEDFRPFTTESVVKFMSQRLLKLKTSLEKAMFFESFQSGALIKLVLMFDGYDEISPHYKENVIELLTILKESQIRQLWVTTRPHLKVNLENKLEQIAYYLQPLSQDDQIDFMVRYWKRNICFTEETLLQDYARQLIWKLTSSIKDRDKHFTAIPLHTKMLAVSFNNEVQNSLELKNHILDIPDKLAIPDLYEKFINQKFFIYQSEKLSKNINNPGVKEEQVDIRNSFDKTFQMLAIKSILSKGEYEGVLTTEINENSGEEKYFRSGLVSVIDDKPHFTHRSFAEYFVADFLVKKLNSGNLHSEVFYEFLWKNIFLFEDYQIIRKFMDGFLEKSFPNQLILKHYGDKLSDLYSSYNYKLWDSFEFTMLYLALDEENFEIIKFILKCVKNINDTENRKNIFNYLSNCPNDKDIALHRAIKKNNLTIVKLLVENGADVEKKNIYGNTSLIVAVDWNAEDIVDWLIISKNDGGGGSDVKAENDLGDTALNLAVSLKNVNIVKFLIENNSNVNHKDKDKNSVLHNAIQSEYAYYMVKTLVEAKANVNAKNSDGVSVLHYAAYKGKSDVVKLLVEQGADITCKSNDGSTILHEAALSGNKELCEWIVEKVPDILYSKDKDGRTPLHEAAERDRIEIIEVLKEKGGEIQAVDNYGNNLFLEAGKYSSKETCQRFIDAKFDIGYTNEKGENLLHVSIKYGNFDVVKWLLSDKKLDPNFKDKKGKPALINICKYVPQVENDELIKRPFLDHDNINLRSFVSLQASDVELIKLLIEHNVNLDDQDEKGKTILHYAAEYKQAKVVEELVSSSNESVSNVAIKDNEGKTALYRAAQKQHWNIAETLLTHGGEITDLSNEQCRLLKEFTEVSGHFESKNQILQLIEQHLLNSSISQ